MKKIISSILVFSMMFAVVGCGESEDNLTQATKLITNIEQEYLAQSDEWWSETADFWHYIGVDGISEERKQTLVNNSFMELLLAEGADDFTKAIMNVNAAMALTVLDYDAREVKSDDVYLNPIYTLASLDVATLKESYFTTLAPYMFILLTEYNESFAFVDYLEFLILEAPKTLEYEWGPSIDSYAMIMQGLVDYNSKSTVVLNAVDGFVDVLSEMQGENGSYGDANADAMAIVALSMLGINGDTDERFVKNENSLVDGLLSYKLKNNGFVGWEAGVWDDYATKQALIALKCYVAVEETGEAYNPFSGGAKNIDAKISE